MKALLDTCIIIDALQSRASFANVAERIFLLATNKKFDGYITANAVADIYYLTHRLTYNDAETRAILKRLFFLFDLLDTTAFDCKLALESSTHDFEDAIMMETAARANMDCIVTRNIKDFVQSPMQILEPQDFLYRLEAENEADCR